MRILEPDSIMDRTYHICFSDSTSKSGYGITKFFHLVDVTNPAQPDSLIKYSTLFNKGDEIDMVRGIKLALANDEDVAPNEDESGWAGADGVINPNLNIYNYKFTRYSKGKPFPHDYEIIFGDSGIAMSTEFQRTSTSVLPAIPVNFTIRNTTLNLDVAFALWEKDGDDGMFTGFKESTK